MKTQLQILRIWKERKLFVLLPLLVLPFLTLLFWALGGGTDSGAQTHQQPGKDGLNADLPDPYLKDQRPLDKLGYYEKTASDSMRLEELMKNDPYYMQQTGLGLADMDSSIDAQGLINNNPNKLKVNSMHNLPSSRQIYTDPNEAKVYKKLDELNMALNQATIASVKTDNYANLPHKTGSGINTKDIDRLEQMMASAQENGSEDPEIKQLNGMMDKILDIQHPERIRDQIKQVSQGNRGKVYSVTQNNSTSYSLLASESEPDKVAPAYNGFYSLNDETQIHRDQQLAIAASIYETQTVVDGSMVKLRLLSDIYVNGVSIPKDNFIFGLATLNGERLNIQINSIRYRNSLFQVQLSVFDMDGLSGIYVPGAITRDVAKQSADRAIQGIGINAIDPSLGAQAASAGIEAAKSLLSRKAKLVKVTVKGGYKVLLRDENQKVSQ